MTRSGSLAYYMAGVVCGSFFYTLVHFVADFGNRASNGVWGRDILLAFFLAPSSDGFRKSSPRLCCENFRGR